eukprot:6181524-Pleurochrysis_carterae.AAC.1
MPTGERVGKMDARTEEAPAHTKQASPDHPRSSDSTDLAALVVGSARNRLGLVVSADVFTRLVACAR